MQEPIFGKRTIVDRKEGFREGPLSLIMIKAKVAERVMSWLTTEIASITGTASGNAHIKDRHLDIED